jgi:hypothetical protein
MKKTGLLAVADLITIFFGENLGLTDIAIIGGLQ